MSLTAWHNAVNIHPVGSEISIKEIRTDWRNRRDMGASCAAAASLFEVTDYST